MHVTQFFLQRVPISENCKMVMLLTVFVGADAIFEEVSPEYGRKPSLAQKQEDVNEWQKLKFHSKKAGAFRRFRPSADEDKSRTYILWVKL